MVAKGKKRRLKRRELLSRVLEEIREGSNDDREGYMRTVLASSGYLIINAMSNLNLPVPTVEQLMPKLEVAFHSALQAAQEDLVTQQAEEQALLSPFDNQRKDKL